MNVAATSIQRASFFALLAVSKRRATPHPKSSNRLRAVAPQDFATPGPDRVRHEVATPGVQIPLERQLGESVVSLGSQEIKTAIAIVAPKFPEDARKIRVSKSPYGV